MAYKPAQHQPIRPTREVLTARMVGIGMLFAAEPAECPSMEETLVFASEEGMEADLRVLGVLTTWMDVHHP